METAQDIDHEISPQLTITVTITDGHGVTVISAVLSITVEDVNEPHVITNLPNVINIDAQIDCPTIPAANPVSTRTEYLFHY